MLSRATERIARGGLLRHAATMLIQTRPRSFLSPPFLLDDYTPRYSLLTPLQEAKKRSAAYAHLRNCNLCPRLCGVNRFEKRGTCLIGADVVYFALARFG